MCLPHKSFNLVAGVWKKRGPTATLQCEAAFASPLGTFAVAVAVVGVGAGPLDIAWTSLGRPLDVLRMSLGPPFDFLWISRGRRFDQCM